MNIPKALINTGIHIKDNHLLAPYTYMKVGGPAQYFAIADDLSQLIKLIKAAHQDNLQLLVLGGGSNVLISDKGIKGLVVINRASKINIIDPSLPQVEADSGVIMNQLINYTINNSLGGLEEFLGIPGTVGGAIINNSHHLTHLIGDYIESVKVISLEGDQKTLTHKQCRFSYDHSIFQETSDIVLSVIFNLKHANKNKLTIKAAKALKRRRDTQPLEFPSSGCMFKNIGEDKAQKLSTPEKISAAGHLIDQAGLKGITEGGAKVSEKHANFIINTGNATSKDVIKLSQKVIQIIKQKYGVTLEREVFLIGE